MRGRSLLADASTPAYRTLCNLGGGTAVQRRVQRERIEVHREGPIGEALLQGDAHQALWHSSDALLRDGRPQHVLEAGLAATLVHRSLSSARAWDT